ncbi:hypothetical protein [Spirilliplanes yamanashiensis]|uniref:Glycosyl transferase family 3 domain-containing protein n=1 Tax=Spirilliplanes yamanashiensis TaxID=42233 RepID=A0A8J3Y4Y5_9ACTN|nr:hypothetical protein [Spirilliplanes yamanashiensis]MDP9819316.1 anthranilate phosphoribosyltransferase [Spirilliplanes yamanashiensis]GIJ01861.1 hypothetical protein Sya03_12130 [Spirilliplanes yamanashiensis]
MHEVIAALIDARTEVGRAAWRSLWDELDAGALDKGDAVALLTSLATRLPGPETLRNLLLSLDERRPAAPHRWPGAVNIVGTGGGPKSFNVSTAAAFVAAAMGVPVVKTGSRAYTSSYGSIDLLDRLGIGLTRSHSQTGDVLARHGIAFAGPYVYPAALTRLARQILPLSMRAFGRFLNATGPLLASVPVTAQVTGVSAQAPLGVLRRLAASLPDRPLWLVANDVGADELLGFADNVIYPNDGSPDVELWPGRFTTSGGDVADLAPITDPAGLVEHFLGVLSGVGNPVATDAVCLNAAALAVAGGHATDWAAAVAAAHDAVRDGAPRRLAESMRSVRPVPLAVQRG